VTQDLCDWADHIYCMEPQHARQIRQRFAVSCELTVLDIPDDYQFNDPELIEILEARLQEYFE
jgi:predicted protein tyrosine phosphatase